MEETEEFFPSHSLIDHAEKSLYPTGRLFSLDLLTPATSCGNRAQTAQVRGITVVAKTTFYLHPHCFGNSLIPQTIARDAHAVYVWHFLSLSPVLLHNKTVSASSLWLFCQKGLSWPKHSGLQQSMCVALTTDQAAPAPADRERWTECGFLLV